MSTPRITIERVALVLVPLATAVVFIAVLAMEKIERHNDLQLISPGQIAVGQTLPLRAFFFVASDELASPAPEATQVDVRVVDDGGNEVSRGELTPARAGHVGPEPMGDGESYEGSYGMEGEIAGPTREGQYTIIASIPRDDETVARCRAPLVVTRTPRPLPARGRPMMPMQQWEHGAVAATPGQTPPRALELRVRGGYCVPEQECELLVWVGEPAASLRIEGGGVTVGPPSPATSTSGIVRFTATVRGPEAVATLIAARAGTEVARREVRLPIVQSGVSFGIVNATCPAPCRPGVMWPGGLRLIVDAFREGVWSRASSVSRGDPDGSTLAVELDEGLWRVQVRSDPFGVESAASYLISVGGDEAGPRAVRDLLLSEGADDPFTLAMPHDGISAADQVAFGGALLETDVVALPRARSGRVQEDIGLGEDRSALRWVSAFFVLSIGLLVAGWAMRRGLVASAEARALMREAGDETAASRKNVVSMTLTVVGIVFATLLAFVAAAILLLTRGV